MSIAAGLTAAKAGLDVARLLMDKLNGPSVDAYAVRSMVQEMPIHVVNAQAALGEALAENSDLREQLGNRKALEALDADMEYLTDGGFYVRKSEADRGLIGYCPLCWKKDGVTVPLQRCEDPGRYRCELHGTSFKTSEYRAPRW